MFFLNKKLSDLQEQDLQILKDNQVQERDTIEYKRDMYGSSDDDKREMLKDIISMANHHGGYLLIGIAENEEGGAPSIDERINASYRMQRAGYKLAFHFDPIIIYDKWEEGYETTINKIFNRINPENVVYISMGTLRYTPEISGFLDKMGPYCRKGEFIRGLDNKMRYFRPLRTGVYKKIKSYLQRYVDPNILYMCMESPTVWEDVFKIKNMSTKRLIQRLDNACINKFAKLVDLK